RIGAGGGGHWIVDLVRADDVEGVARGAGGGDDVGIGHRGGGVADDAARRGIRAGGGAEPAAPDALARSGERRQCGPAEAVGGGGNGARRPWRGCWCCGW